MKSKLHSIFSPTIRVALTLACSSGVSFALDWDPDPTLGIQQGDGSWNNSGSNLVWTADSGTTNVPWTQNPAVFNGPVGTSVISLTSSVTANGLNFVSSGYTLQSSSTVSRTINMAGNLDLGLNTENTIGNKVIVSRGSNMTVGASANATPNAGTLNIASGGTVRVSSGGSSNLFINGNGTVINVFGELLKRGGGSGRINLGSNGTGITDVTLNIKSGGEVRNDDNIIQVGYASSSVASPDDVKGTINVESGGLMKIGPSGNQEMRLGQFGSAFLNVEGTVESGNIAMGNGGNGYGVLNLNTGGVLTTSQFNMNKPLSILNFDGGTLQASGDNATFINKAFGTINVRDGGLILNSNGFEVTVPRALLHSSIGTDAPIDGGLTKAGTGTLILTAANDYTGPTTITAGTLELADGGTILAGDVTSNGVFAFNKTTDVIFGDVVSGTGGLTQSGLGKLSLTNANTYNGPTTVTDGILELDNGTAVSDDSRLVIDGSGVVELTQNETVKSLFYGALPQPAGTYGSTSSTATNTDDTRFSGSGVLTVLTEEGPDVLSWDTSTDPGFQKADGDWNLTATNWSPEGTALYPWNEAIAANFGGVGPTATVTVTEDLGALALNFISDYALVGDGTPRTITMGGGQLSIGDGTSNSIGNDLTVTRNEQITIGQTAGNNSGSLAILSGGTIEKTTDVGDLRIEGLNTAVSVSGTLQVPSGKGRINLGSNQTSGTDVSLTIESGGQVVTETDPGGSTANNLIQVGFASSAIADPADVSGTVTVMAGGLLRSGTGGNRAIRLGQYGTGTLDVEASGLVQADSVVLGNGGNGTGILNLNGGTIETGSVFFNKADSVANFDGGILKVTADTAPIIRNGSGTANILDGGLTIDTNGFSSSATEDLLAVGAGGLTKAGAGTLELTGANDYSGPTNINAGTLLIANQPTANGDVNVNNDATLGGTGSIGGNVTVGSAASIAPGTSAGTLFMEGILDISAMAAGAGTLDFELDALAGTNDLIDVFNTVTIGSGVLGISDLNISNLGGLEVGTYTLIFTNGIGVTGTLDGADLTGAIAPGFNGELQINANNIDLVVTGGALSAYDTWLAGFTFAPGADTSPTGDPDKDGLSNQDEFAFGLDPTSGSAVNPIKVTLDKSTGQFTYTRYATSGLTYKVLTSTTLSSWTEDVSATQTPGAVDGSGNQDVVVTLSGLPLTADKLFIRVSAE